MVRGSEAKSMALAALTLCLSACGIFGHDLPDPPAEEAAFVAVKAGLTQAYDQASDDIVKAKIDAQWREKDSCSIVKQPGFTDWVGTVAVDPVGGTLAVDIGNGITLKDDAYAVASKESSGLEEGDGVEISGAFVSDDPACAAQIVGAPWDEKAIQTPTFKVRLASVKRLSGSWF